MEAMNRNLVEYNGINSGLCKGSKLPYFNQINQDFTFCVPQQKPDIEQIVKVWATPCIVWQKLVVTPVGTSLEGQNITGYKLMIAGDVSYKVQYVALETTQSMHTAETIIPFCAYIVLPADFNPSSMITASVVLEDINSEQLDTRCIYNNLTMMVIADRC